MPSYLEKDDDKKESAPEFCLDAGVSGNVARFINHSCQPNLFVQCVLSTHHDIKLARVMLFAADNIPPLKVFALLPPSFQTRVYCICNINVSTCVYVYWSSWLEESLPCAIVKASLDLVK